MKLRLSAQQRSLVAWLVLLGSSVAAGPARANCASPRAPEISVLDVRAGETVTLRWPGLPKEARELVVLLSVDGGANFSLRASAQVDAARASVRWRVPALPTAHARLRLRWGDGRCERLLPPTAEFRILAEAGGGPATAPAPARVAAWDEDDPTTAGPLSAGAVDLHPNAPGYAMTDPALPGVATARAPDARPADARALPSAEPLRTAPPITTRCPDATASPRAPRRE
jgi:hypothetical protein